jgi:hypothetical protein
VKHLSSAQRSSNLAVIVNRQERVTDLVVFLALRTTLVVLRSANLTVAGVWPSFAMTCGDNVAADDPMELNRTQVIGALALGALLLLGLLLRYGKFSG